MPVSLRWWTILLEHKILKADDQNNLPDQVVRFCLPLQFASSTKGSHSSCNEEAHILGALASWDESAVILEVDGEQFHVNRVLLSMYSPVIKAMFGSDFKEKDAAVIPLPGKEAKEFLDLLYQVYSQQPENLTSKLN